MQTEQLRKIFLDYFSARDHKVVASAPLVPGNDPTLLFTNAGMVQFKDVFLGAEKRSYTRAASSQRCIRAGGKHNDLENVGYTARHHTFFEMLGNFSFGDYFKEDAIHYAWNFLTEELGLDEKKLWVTVFESDDEAADIWLKKVGVSPDRFNRMGEKDNFWSMGDTGPCGPCSEIFYDHGPEIAGGPPGSPDEEGDRYVEIWNLVFMQFDRQADGQLDALPSPSVDTGMGLERMAAVLQGVHSNYEIDLFQKLITKAAKVTGTKDLTEKSLNVIADHIRACAFLIVDGVLPGNEGRGYVLRRVVRRALRHGYKLGCEEPFFHRLVGVLVDVMGEAYPELAQSQAHVEKVLLAEEKKFSVTLAGGMKLLGGETSMVLPALRKLQDELGGEIGIGWRTRDGGDSDSLDGTLLFADERYAVEVVRPDDVSRKFLQDKIRAFNQAQESENDYIKLIVVGVDFPPDYQLDPKLAALLEVADINIESRFYSSDELQPFRVVPGETAFKLFDTYGFPVDLTIDAARELGFEVDTAGFNFSMNEQRERSRAASRFGLDADAIQVDGSTQFTGYAQLTDKSVITALFKDGGNVTELNTGDIGHVILAQTPFYAESGGQIGDKGVLSSSNSTFAVRDTQKQNAVHVHFGAVESGALKVGDTVTTHVDAASRSATALNHTATHLLHAALRNVLGEHVTQQGSLVTTERLRFDFSHYEALNTKELTAIELMVNAQIRANAAVQTDVMDYDAALESGAVALFGEKYGDDVRVLTVGDFSVELCGGTHVSRVGDIGLFKIVSESGIASGVRRIEALTGEAALQFVRDQGELISRLGGMLRTEPDNLENKLKLLQDKNREFEKELKALRLKVASGAGQDLATEFTDVSGIKVLALRLDDDTDSSALRDTVDRIKDKLGTAVVVLGCVTEDGKVCLAAGVSKDTTSRIKAGDLVRDVAATVGGKGGGRPDFAQAGGTNPAALDQALAQVVPWVRDHL